MKTILAAAAAFAFATSAFAAARSAPVESKSVQKAGILIELAKGPNRNAATSTSRNDSKSRERNKGSTKDGRSVFTGK